MKVLNASSALACCALGLALIAPVRAQQPNQDFQLAFCNTSSYGHVLVSLAYRLDAQRWRVDGWYPLPDYGCALVGSFQRDTVYYFAHGQTSDGRAVTWAAPDTDQTATAQCVDREKFFGTATGVPTCPTGQELARFRMLKVPPNTARITWTLSD
jgi:uncharacterized membrane protein